jgi:hypothetical protein
MGRSSIRVAGVEKNAALVTDWGEEVSRQSRTGELSSLEGVSVNGPLMIEAGRLIKPGNDASKRAIPSDCLSVVSEAEPAEGGAPASAVATPFDRTGLLV